VRRRSRARVSTVGVALVVLAAAIAAATLTIPGATKNSPQVVVDPRGFPRLFSLGRCGHEAEVSRNDLVVGYAYCDIAKLRKLNPHGIYLLNPGVYPSGYRKGIADYGGMNVTYGSGLYYWKGVCDRLPHGTDLGCIRAFDPARDFLHNADGSIAGITNGIEGHRGWNLAQPDSAELVAKVMAYAAKQDGLYSDHWDGIWSDNWIYGVIGRSFAYGPNLDTNGDGKTDNPATLRREWDNGLNRVGSMLRAALPGKIVGGNGNWYGDEPGDYFGSDPEGWLKTANLTTIEAIERWWDKPSRLLQIGARWLNYPDPGGMPRYLLLIQDALGADGAKLTIAPDADPNAAALVRSAPAMRSMRWGLTLSLMAGAYYRIVVEGDAATQWWYDEYDGGRGVRRRNYLGPATSHAKSVAKDAWRRDFRNGIALNNSSDRTVAVELHGRFRHLRGTQAPRLNNGKVVSRVTIPPHDGVILLRTKR
jgi:hypothetical protein